MTRKIESVLNNVLEDIEPDGEEMNRIFPSIEVFIERLKSKIEKKNIDAEVFLGGSFAKKTVVKKGNYDADIFVRFSKNYKDISKITKKLLKGLGRIKTVHGSRDYFRIKKDKDLFIEVVPVKKIKKPEEAENTTDLSYEHVSYINKKVKSKKALQGIKLAKAFCNANKCYGAESYIKGFSGYALELLVYYYGSFEKFIREMSKVKDKLVIDIEKHFKNKKQVLMDLNASKLNSPVILVDPTYKQRNALAALSEEQFRNFQKKCKEFLKNPSEEFFEKERIDLNEIKENAEKKGEEFSFIEIKTNKQKGDVAGSKLYKFYRHLEEKIGGYFKVKDKGFNYNQNKKARIYFVAEPKEKILVEGPFVSDKENVEKFRENHQDVFEKDNKIYAEEKTEVSLRHFLRNWKKEHKKHMKEMNISKLDILY